MSVLDDEERSGAGLLVPSIKQEGALCEKRCCMKKFSLEGRVQIHLLVHQASAAWTIPVRAVAAVALRLSSSFWPISFSSLAFLS